MYPEMLPCGVVVFEVVGDAAVGTAVGVELEAFGGSASRMAPRGRPNCDSSSEVGASIGVGRSDSP